MAWASSLSSLNNDGRTSQRKAVKLTALVHDGLTINEVEIVNLSPTGALLVLPSQPRQPTILSLELPETGRVAAKVVWQDGNMFGCEFEAPLPRAAVSAALLRSRPVSTTNEPSIQPDASDATDASHDSLPLRTRLMIITGLACIAWVPIALPLFLWLR